MFEQHWKDNDGNPAGGVSSSRGLTISWQNGPLGRGTDRTEPNGAFVEDAIQASIGRLLFYQSSKFHCEANADAIEHLREALRLLNERTAEREARGVEGTHQE